MESIAKKPFQLGRWTDEERVMEYYQTVDKNPFIPFVPHPKQRLFLLLGDVEEILYGGGTRSGKVTRS